MTEFPPLIAPQDYQELCAQMYQGCTPTEIAKRLDISRQSHYSYLERGVIDPVIAGKIKGKAALAVTDLRARARALDRILTR